MTLAHDVAHGNWLGPDECHICVSDLYDSPFVRLTPEARFRIGVKDFRAIDERARRLNARVGALYSFGHHDWIVTADDGEHRVQLRGQGPLVAVLSGVLDDLETSRA